MQPQTPYAKSGDGHTGGLRSRVRGIGAWHVRLGQFPFLAIFVVGRISPVIGQQPFPDLLLTGGKVFTADPAGRYAEAIAIRGERIVAVGASGQITAVAGPHTRRIDLQGHTVIPGINDAHYHLMFRPAGMALTLSPDTTDPAMIYASRFCRARAA